MITNLHCDECLDFWVLFLHQIAEVTIGTGFVRRSNVLGLQHDMTGNRVCLAWKASRGPMKLPVTSTVFALRKRRDAGTQPLRAKPNDESLEFVVVKFIKSKIAAHLAFS